MALQDEIVRAETHIRNHILNFINTCSLKCAVELGIPDVIHKHGGPITLEQLVDALAINKAKANHLGRLMRLMTRSGFFVDANDGYALGPPPCLLIKDHLFSLVPFVLGATGPLFTGPWRHVSEWFHNDDSTPYQTAYGKTFWDCTSQDPELNHHFNQAMARSSLLVMSLVKKYCREVFEGFDSLVDVGGGIRKVAKAFADEFPDMKYTVLDLPHVVAGLERTKNLVYVGGNMFEVIRPAQAVFLKMMVHFDGRERTLEEWVKIFNDANFTDYKITELGLMSLIQLFLNS